MSEWKDISTAPKDGTWIQARIPGYGSDNIIAWRGWYVTDEDDEVCAWTFMTEQEPPDCWTDGVCWKVNEDGKASVQPTHWMPLPPPPAPKGEG